MFFHGDGHPGLFSRCIRDLNEGADTMTRKIATIPCKCTYRTQTSWPAYSCFQFAINLPQGHSILPVHDGNLNEPIGIPAAFQPCKYSNHEARHRCVAHVSLRCYWCCWRRCCAVSQLFFELCVALKAKLITIPQGIAHIATLLSQ